MTRTFALVFGILYLLVGIVSFIPGVSPHDATLDSAHPINEAVHFAHGRALGLFPVNALHNIVHIAIGVWGIVGSRSASGARLYAQGVAIFYGLLTVLGAIPSEMTKTLFGLVPLHGYDILLHAGSALIAAYFGFVRKD